MKPRLYSKSHDWKHNGYGFLSKCLRCEVTEDLETTDYSLEMEIPRSDRLYNALETGLLVRAKPNHLDPTQFFVIDKLKVNKQGIATVNAQHIKSDFFNNIVRGNLFGVSDDWIIQGNAQQVVNKILKYSIIHRNWKDTNDVEHSFSDVVQLNGFSSSDVQRILLTPPFNFEEAFLGENGFIKKFGGEFRFDNERIKIYKNRGEQKPLTLRFGSGISEFDQEMSNDDVYDVVIAYAKVKTNEDNEYTVYYGYPEAVYHPLTDAVFGSDFTIRAHYHDMTSEFSSYTYEETSEAESHIQEALFISARDQFIRNRYDQPKINVKVTTASQLRRLQDVGLADSVNIVCGNGTVVSEKVTKVTYDSIKERYIQHEFGEKKVSLKDFINYKEVKR